MRESQLRKIQKQRHMSNIYIMLLNNPIFKNLSRADQKKMAKLIYKAEMIEVHARDKELIRVNTSIQDIMNALRVSLEDDIEFLKADDFDDDDDQNDEFGRN
jgi:hypothetical protein